MNTHLAAGAMTENVDFQGKWDSVWTTIKDALGSGVVNILGIIGMLLVVGGIITYFWQKRKGGGGGGGQDNTKLMWTVIVGAILASPTLISTVLWLVDAIANVFINLVTSNSGQ